MGLFKRKRDDDELLEEQDDAARAAEADAEQDPVPTAPTRPQGPWDAADAPEDSLQRLDLGGLLVPVPPQTEVRVEMSPERQVLAATLVRGTSAMQLSAFAAPRTEGIWGEVREEIAASLESGGGTASAVDGPWGTELVATVPTEVAGQGRLLMPARFLGVDGPRWFLRALLTGPAATEPGADADLLEALRAVVVVRGTDPMAVRDPLPLALPKQVAEAAASSAQQAAGRTGASPAPPPAVPERGPEITEIR